jgi:multisubunit Na+/H+ antiporter MnhG subunit
MKQLWSLVWPDMVNRSAAPRCVSTGVIAAALGAIVVFYQAGKTFRIDGPTFSSVVIPIVGAVLLAMAAVGLHRRAPSSSALALATWLCLGVIPSGIPLCVGGTRLVCSSATRTVGMRGRSALDRWPSWRQLCRGAHARVLHGSVPI